MWEIVICPKCGTRSEENLNDGHEFRELVCPRCFDRFPLNVGVSGRTEELLSNMALVSSASADSPLDSSFWLT